MAKSICQQLKMHVIGIFRMEIFYQLSNFGIMDEETVAFTGANAKMNEFQAAMGLCNLDHIDENILNNRADNLRYLPVGENAARSTRGICRNPSKNKMEGNPRTKAVVGISNSGSIIETLSCAKYLSIKHNINYSTLKNKLQHGGIRIGEIHYQYALSC